MKKKVTIVIKGGKVEVFAGEWIDIEIIDLDDTAITEEEAACIIGGAL